MVVDALSRRYALLSMLDAKLLGFEYIKNLYAKDSEFGDVFNECEKVAFDKFIGMIDFYFGKINYAYLYVPCVNYL